MTFGLPLALFVMLAPAPAEQADAAWAEGRYAEAAEAYARAYAETGDIAYLYARAQAQQESGDCVGATATYEAFIATEPLPEAIAAAEAAVEQCRAQLPAREPDPPPTPTPTITPPPTPQPARRDPAPRPWHRDPAGATLVAVGSAGIVAGVVLAVVARTEQAEAERASDVDQYGEHNDRAVTLSRAAIPVLAIGGALLVGGAVRWGLLARKQRIASARVRLGSGLAIRF
jgi:tetratricopeptide (TPR) repeat protein